MRLDVHVRGKHVAQLYRERDEYVLKYVPDAAQADSKKNVALRALVPDIEAAGLPAPEPAVHERAIIGRSELLGQR